MNGEVEQLNYKEEESVDDGHLSNNCMKIFMDVTVEMRS